ncbi:hypothetical protein JTB14_015555 [Gonioctena quinquepunctata]|nr:hypothetical protein JTB14_015555 [Gonioctena quinquepunctata]
MIAFASGFEMDVDRFRSYVHETTSYFISLYPWYNISPTMPKYLIHGPEIISCALLLIEQLSEEAQEARNKYFGSSDPVITSRRKIKKRTFENIPVEALQLSSPFDSSSEEEEEKEKTDDADSNF